MSAAAVPAGAVVPAVRHWEILRRRRLLIGLAVLIALSTSPVVGHHVVGAVDWLPISLQHAGALCLVALHHLLAPVHSAFHVLLAAGLLAAIVDRGLAIMRARRVLRGLLKRVPEPGDEVYWAAKLAEIEPQAVRVVVGLPVPAFTVGWVRPMIYISADLSDRLSTEELAAVLAHEGVHRARRDPLRLSGLRFLAHVLFWIPALRRVADDLADEAEIEADTVAAQRFPLELASALVTLAGGPNPRLAGDVAEFQAYDLLERRVQRLAGLQPMLATRVSTRSLAGAALILVAAWSSGVMVLHPLPGDVAEGPPPHCMHHSGGPLLHLFCQGPAWRWRSVPCQHIA